MPKTEKNDSIYLTGERKLQEFTDGVVTYEQVTTLPMLERVETRQTVNTPNFRSYRKGSAGTWRDNLPMNPFTYELTTINHAYGRVVEERGPSVVGVETGVIGLGENFVRRGISGPIRTELRADALTKSLLELKSKKVDLGVMFKERTQTGKLLTDSVTNISKAFLSLKRGSVSGALDALSGNPRAAEAISKRGGSASRRIKKQRSSLADLWLQLQYGWKPLLSDVYNSAEALARESDRPRRFRVSSSKTFTWNQSEWEAYQGLPVRRSETGSLTRKYVYIFSYSNEAIQSLSELGITNPALIAWEVLPFSFVIDWFVGIGTYLDTLDATLGLAFEKGCVTDFERSIVKYHGVGAGIAETGRYVKHDFRASHKHVLCTRTPLTGFPFAELPSFDTTPKSVSHGVTFAALVRQGFKPLTGQRI